MITAKQGIGLGSLIPLVIGLLFIFQVPAVASLTTVVSGGANITSVTYDGMATQASATLTVPAAQSQLVVTIGLPSASDASTGWNIGYCPGTAACTPTTSGYVALCQIGVTADGYQLGQCFAFNSNSVTYTVNTPTMAAGQTYGYYAMSTDSYGTTVTYQTALVYTPATAQFTASLVVGSKTYEVGCNTGCTPVPSIEVSPTASIVAQIVFAAPPSTYGVTGATLSCAVATQFTSAAGTCPFASSQMTLQSNGVTYASAAFTLPAGEYTIQGSYAGASGSLTAFSTVLGPGTSQFNTYWANLGIGIFFLAIFGGLMVTAVRRKS